VPHLRLGFKELISVEPCKNAISCQLNRQGTLHNKFIVRRELLIGGISREVYHNLQRLGKQFDTKILMKMKVMSYEEKYRFVEGLLLQIPMQDKFTIFITWHNISFIYRGLINKMYRYQRTSETMKNNVGTL
jgi:hypothetical protein